MVRAALVGVLAVAALGASADFAAAATFNPALVISDGNMRAYDSMSAADIQAFLNAQPGPLKTLVTPDHNGVNKSAAQIIADACSAQHISPKVMLVMLDKEQSLIARKTWTTSGLKYALDWAVGCGVPDTGSRTAYTQGFGNQIWYGANWLSSYGEVAGFHWVPLYTPGMTYPVTFYSYYSSTLKRTVTVKGTISPANVATYKLYVYNPSVGARTPYGDLSGQSCSGNANFWKIYMKYFGDPFSDPQVRAVYCFTSRSNGSQFYTSSYADRYRFMNSKYWRYQGVSFSWDSTTSPNASGAVNSLPVVRFYDRTKRTYLYTSSQPKIASLRSSRYSARYRYEGVAWRVTSAKTGVTNVFCFQHRKNGSFFYTSSPRIKAKYLAAKTYRYTGTFQVVE